MPDQRFYHYSGSRKLESLLSVLPNVHTSVRDTSNILIKHASSIESACEGDIGFYRSGSDRKYLENSSICACFIDRENAHLLEHTSIIPLITPSPRSTFAAVLNILYKEIGFSTEDKRIHPKANIGKNVKIGPGCVIGSGADIGDNCILEPNVVVGPGCVLGSESCLSAGSVLKSSIVGKNFLLGANSAIGYPGFAVALSKEGPVDLLHIGRVIIGDHVLVGGGTMIDRGLIEDTIIGNKVKIDNLCQIAHNVQIGEGTVIAGMVGIAGSAKIGRGVLMGARSGISDHVQIGDGTRLAAAGLVINDIPDGETWGGVPARPHREWMRELVYLRKLGKRK